MFPAHCYVLKVPMANFTPSEKSKRATLGPRKDYSMMMGKLLGKITNIVPVDGTTAVEADEAEASLATFLI